MTTAKKKKWPTYVTERNGTIAYRPRIPKAKQHLVDTKSGWLSPPWKLGKSTDPEIHILQQYNEARKALDAMLNPKDDEHGTLGWLYEQYQKSIEWKELSTTSQKSYQERLERFLGFKLEINDQPATVANIPLKALTRPVVKKLHREILESYQEKGMKGVNTVNGQIRQLSAMISWGLDTYDDLGLVANPCLGIKKPTAPKPDRYITDQEYDAQLEFACAQDFDWLPIFFELAYLLACRSVEVRHITLDDILEQGVLVRRRKGSKANIILWSPRLKRAVEAAKQLREKRIEADPSRVQLREQNYLLTSRNGQVSDDGLKSAMSRLKKSMKANGLEKVFWTAHDLKRKGISDAESTKIAGHKSPAMEQLYDTKLHEYQPPK